MNEHELLIRRAAFYLNELFQWDGQIEDLCAATPAENPNIDGEKMLNTLREFVDMFLN